MLKLLGKYYQAHKTRINRLSKEGGWIVGGQIASLLGALALVRVLTEYLSPDQYGQLALALTMAGLVNQLVMGGLIAGVGRYYSVAVEKKDIYGYLQATCHLLAFATAAVLIIGLIFVASLQRLGYSHWVALSAAVLLFSLISGYSSTLNVIQNAARQRATAALHGGLDAWLKILLAVGAVFWIGNTSTAVIIGYVLSSILITISQLICLGRAIPEGRASVRNRQAWLPQIWAYSLPFTAWGAFTWMQQISDRWALEMYASTSDVGQYAVLLQLGFTPAAQLTAMAMNFLGPIMYQLAGDATDQARNIHVHRLGWRLVQACLVVTLITCVIALVLHDWLFESLVASEYRDRSYLLPWFVLSGGIFAAGQLLALRLMSEMKSHSMTRAKIVTALIGVLLNASGAAFAGVEGVVGGLVAFSIIYFVWMSILVTRLSEESRAI